MLEKALHSLVHMEVPVDVNVMLLVCDNDKEHSAKDMVCRYASQLAFPVKYLQETNRGIVFMRNKILEEAKSLRSDFLAFVDDDEVVDKQWLYQLYTCQKAFDADLVCGRVIYQWPLNSPLLDAHKKAFSNRKKRKTGDELDNAGTSNVLYRLTAIEQAKLCFHPALNLRGGSDILFSKMLHDSGAKLVWCNEAITYEEMPETRATPDWIFNRRYRYGQSRFLIDKYRFGLQKARINNGWFCFIEFFRLILFALVAPFASKDYKIGLKRDLVYTKGVLDALLGLDYQEYGQTHGD